MYTREKREEPGKCYHVMMVDVTPLSALHVYKKRGVVSTQYLPSRDNIYHAGPPHSPQKCKGHFHVAVVISVASVQIMVAVLLQSNYHFGRHFNVAIN